MTYLHNPFAELTEAPQIWNPSTLADGAVKWLLDLSIFFSKNLRN